MEEVRKDLRTEVGDYLPVGANERQVMEKTGTVDNRTSKARLGIVTGTQGHGSPSKVTYYREQKNANDDS